MLIALAHTIGFHLFDEKALEYVHEHARDRQRQRRHKHLPVSSINHAAICSGVLEPNGVPTPQLSLSRIAN